jgi:hypothetical protein
MKKLLFPVFLPATLLSCDNESGDLKYSETISGGCAVNNCLCYYTYNFKFSGNANSYKYNVGGSNLNFIV